MNPPGLIVVPIGTMTRFTPFWVSLFALSTPKGSHLSLTQGSSVAANLNTAIRQTLLPHSEYQWVWIVGDDHTFQRDIIHRLLQRKKEFVVPICAMRHPPFHPSVFKAPSMRALTWEEIEAPPALQEIDGSGYAGGLIRREVFETLKDPWFEIKTLPNGGTWGEDIWFCMKAQQAGFQIWLDTAVNVGHITNTILDPQWTPEGWTVSLDMGHMIPPGATADAREPLTTLSPADEAGHSMESY